MQRDAVCYSMLQYVAGYCSVLQCVAVCCSVLQCVAVYSAACGSMLQRSVTARSPMAVDVFKNNTICVCANMSAYDCIYKYTYTYIYIYVYISI